MIDIRKSDDRGHAKHGWLDSHHTFSFANYYDPKFMGFRTLRVINQDRVQAGQGFGKHPHEDMEIISYVLEGALAHTDSMGNGSTLKYGDVQRMSAGTGVIHGEFNASKEELVHFLQIWIAPEKTGVKPGYEEKHFTEDEKKNRLRLVVSKDGKDGSIKINQDVSLYASILDKDKTVELSLGEGRHSWIQVIRGKIAINGEALDIGDGAAISDTTILKIKATELAEFLVFDLN